MYIIQQLLVMYGSQKGLIGQNVLTDPLPLQFIHVSNAWLVGMLDTIDAAIYLLEKYCTFAVAKQFSGEG
ncbi:MAG TPA: hypothetical protein DD644_03610 [Halomonas sp.]|uniref:Uncharacterized protein n=1 Tax=Halomonas campaniensis TaxID=213554 RepID=A0A3D0KH08_9GAMM|nr:hypothetical protein [Halomonas sp.]HBS82722.1 hypothetical protein [Halomonas campaniensis]HCA02857.1 hypothetical protein [Halomonas campaniensis]